MGVIVIFRDVTEQKRAEDKIHDGVRRRDQFLAMLSHELRNPLSAIVTATALLKSDKGGSPVKKAGRFLRSSSASPSRWPTCWTTCSRQAE